MAILNGGLMHKCFPKHSSMGTARMKLAKETDEEGKKRGVSMERNKAGIKKRNPDSLSNLIKIQTMNYLIRYVKSRMKFNLKTKTNGLKQLKNQKSSTPPPPLAYTVIYSL